ncbi:hypothetical protein WISP_132624 [Willisornis vidua]|uniref:Uncharacterized protein n=1 Tax=Willisornis vidua TaxID=1566151 RepID=A0ABQ9CP68_9PASS|nr:hypothetical protein WISP_132624 [Willisornis vidua]
MSDLYPSAASCPSFLMPLGFSLNTQEQGLCEVGQVCGIIHDELRQEELFNMSNLVWWKVSLFMAGMLELVDL